ncbi:DUF5666 domain-containing protein [Mycobacterium sp. Aquia_216]|uniref:DUF5666 domain-containing protein n=1 Tax=Mycobacterium sp. Aquia_216 TaxID=2991729 RepID=UPI00227D5FD4|nr:DUF5666 domain-containing protein [Mycobacterium sp. Aquia_216]WAJ47289.1 DUF5666 domain-containing protein [Mycobacterium sp. Aquia_216]
MFASSQTLTRFALLAVTGVTAVSVAACGSSNTASPGSSPGTTSSASSPAATTTPPTTGQARVRGLIASVSGNTAQVTQEKGNAAVAFTPSTKVTEITPAALSDVTAGSCVTVRPAHQESRPGQPLTAASVRVSPAVDGKCPQGKEAAPGDSTTPAPSGTPTTTPAKRAPVRGAVASVAGNTITVTSTDAGGSASQTPVTVTDKTRYSKQAGADVRAIAQGKCLTAQGTKDGSGTLQATNIDLRPAHDGKCGGSKPAGHGG